MLVDDHPLLRKGVTSLINGEPDLCVCAEAKDLAEAIKLIAQSRPEIAIVELSLRGDDGFETVKEISSLHPALPILVFSAHDEERYAERALRAGSHGYVMKNATPQKLIAAIRRVLAGELSVSDTIKPHLLHRLSGKRSTWRTADIDSLSDRELEVFRLVGEGLPTRQIAGRLGLSVRTVETHREHLKAKLGVQTNAQLINRACAFVWNPATKPRPRAGSPRNGSEFKKKKPGKMAGPGSEVD